MSRFRVLHVVQYGDTSGYFPQLARFANRERYELSFATLNPAEQRFRDTLAGLDTPCLSLGFSRRPLYPAAALRLARHLRKSRIDVVHTHLFEPSVVGLVAARLAGTPVRLLTRHYSDYHTRIDKRWHVRMDRLCTRLADAVIAVSRHTAEHLVDVEGAPASKVRTIVNGIDFGRLTAPTAEARMRLRGELGGDAKHVLLLPGRLHPEKGHPHLFEALSLLRGRTRRPLLALLAGDGPFRSAYEADVARRELQDQVRFLGFRHDLPDLMAMADLVVLPSVAEAFGLVLTEALYLGTPVVASRVGGVPEIVSDGVDGLLVPPGEPAALAAALERVLGDDALRQRLAGAGREQVVGRFAFDAMMRGYESLYAELLERAGRRAA